MKKNFGVRFEFEVMEGYTLQLKWPETEGDYGEVRAGGVDLSIKSEKKVGAESSSPGYQKIQC